jgi:MYXO-CTERM domain-containing protein
MFGAHEPAPASAVTPAASAGPDDGGWRVPVLTALILAAILALAIFRRQPRLARPWKSRSSTTPSR